MELAIPGIALGLMYIMKGQSNNSGEQEESFANQNALPNTDIPNRNYPDEYPVNHVKHAKQSLPIHSTAWQYL